MNLSNIKNNKLYVGPMSLNIVDAVLESDTSKLGFIPSRRQVDYDGGYVNNWTTETFSKYVNGKVAIERDHGGPGQGTDDRSDHLISFQYDAKYFDIIHIDPWKKHHNIDDAIFSTIEAIKVCLAVNENCYFEVGTEEAIQRLEVITLEQFMDTLKSELDPDAFSRIAYLVIQSGTALHEDSNIGNFELWRLQKMIALCKQYGVMSKEHNGDFLSSGAIHERFALGLDAINIAPEFGHLETQVYINHFKKYNEHAKLDKMFDICLKSSKWKKWVSSDFDPYNNKEKLVKITGHYIFSDPEFLDIKPDAKEEVKETIKRRISDITQ
jgi:hypothetical protein